MADKFKKQKLWILKIPHVIPYQLLGSDSEQQIRVFILQPELRTVNAFCERTKVNLLEDPG